MEQKQPSSATPGRTRRRGLVIVNTGDGKGKTTAALGLLFRAWGWDMKVVMFQFIKKTGANYGEHRAARRMGVTLLARGDGFTNRVKDLDRSKSLAQELWGMAREKIAAGPDDMVILDELSYPLRYGWIPVEEVLRVLQERPRWVHVVVTGRDMPQEIIEAADLVTEMRELKHPFREGIKAQKGIEF